MAKIVDSLISFMGPGNNQFVAEQCQYFHGKDATFWAQSGNGHIWDWAAKKPNDVARYGLNFQQFSDACRPYGKNWRIVPSYAADGKSPLDAYSLRYFHPYSWDWHVLPIVLISADHNRNNEGVKLACENYLHNMNAVSDWYASQVGKGFRILRPIAIPTQISINGWHDIYKAQEDRGDLLWKCKDVVTKYFENRTNSNIIYAVTQYNGFNPDWDYDAAASSNFMTVSSFATNWKFYPGTSSPMDETVMYALAHELGHCFGLGHTEQAMAQSEDYANSVMLWGKPNAAILVKYEIERLKKNPFFMWT